MDPSGGQRGTLRGGQWLQVDGAIVLFRRNMVSQVGAGYELRPRLFVSDPWGLITRAIDRAVPEARSRDIAHSFRRQAEDYFRAATLGRELAVRPVLLYYAFLNLSKAYAMTRGNTEMTERAYHGISAELKTSTILGAAIKFDRGVSRVLVFQELLNRLGGDPTVLQDDLPLGHLLPQILPGHRLWCDATGQSERFVTVQRFEVLHSPEQQTVWLSMELARAELERFGGSESQALLNSGLSADFELTDRSSAREFTRFQQRAPVPCASNLASALGRILLLTRTRLWETVRIVSPYRKTYVYLCPAEEQKSRLPQLPSIYLLMFFLGYVTRYAPGYFRDLLDSEYGPLFEAFLSESPSQFLYLMASEILDQEISRPAIV